MTRIINTDSSSLILSIIIPVYNVEAYIKRCLDSVVNLTNLNFEVIVVNDGTEDNSMDIVKEYAQGHNNIFIINQNNQGLGEARNVGLRNAKGKYVYFLDSDDYLNPNEFHSLFCDGCRLSSDVIIGDFSFVKNGIKVNDSNFSIKTENYLLQGGEDFFLTNYRIINTPVWRSIYKRDYLLKNNFFFSEGRYHEDVNWTPKVLISAHNVYYSPISFYNYVIRDGSIVNSTKSQKKISDLIFVYNDLMQYSTSQSIAVQKEISYNCVSCLLIISGQYKINTQSQNWKDIKSVFNIRCAHYWYIKALLCLSSICPNLFNMFFRLRYSR